jgi:hypothetical protein
MPGLERDERALRSASICGILETRVNVAETIRRITRVETLRGKFSDLPEEVALARADEAALSAREQSRAARMAHGSKDSSDSTDQGA